jgi:hypothetical protein
MIRVITELLYFFVEKWPTNAQGSSEFVLMRSKFYPDMFRQMFVIFRGSYVPYKPLKQCSVFGRIRIMIRPVWPAVVERQLDNAQTHSIACVAYKAPTTPWRWQPFVETRRDRIWNALIKIHYFLEHLLVISQRYNKMLSPTIKILYFFF